MKVARIFEDVGGYYVCDEDGPLDTRGVPHATKAEALRAAAKVWPGTEPYTHAVGSGTYWDGVRAIPAKYRD